MNDQARPPLSIKVTNLGPVANLDATLSKNAQNLIYARNGTGKSFLTRALRYLDLHAQGGDVSEAAFNLVSEEAADSQGSFSLIQGPTDLGTLHLHFSGNTVSADSHDRLFHVFSDEFVHSELRQQNFDLDGNIESEIQLDQANIDTKEAELRLANAREQAAKRRRELETLLEAAKSEDLVGKAAVRRQLSEYTALKIDGILSATSQPELPERSLKSLVGDLDALKSIPAEPDYPIAVGSLAIPVDRLDQIVGSLSNTNGDCA